MAKVIAPFKIVGTLDDHVFYISGDGNFVREKGTPGVTKEQFKAYPVFDRIRQQSTEFGSCVVQSHVFRLLFKQFYDRAKEVSFAGRVNQLLFDILKEDQENPIGTRQIASGLATKEGKEFLLGFEANILRTLPSVSKKSVVFDWSTNEVILKNFDFEKDLKWPEPEANQVHFQLAIANWNCVRNEFESHYSEELIFSRSAKRETLHLRVEPLNHSDLWMAFIYIGFSNRQRNKTKMGHRRWNTASCIAYKCLVDSN